MWLSLIAIIVSVSGVAAAQSDDEDEPAPPEPIIVSDDIRTHAPVARHLIEASLTLQRATADTDAIDLYSFQLGLGPTQIGQENKLANIIHRSDHYSIRARFTLISPKEGAAVGGPITLALQRHEDIEKLVLPELLRPHWGFEFAVATPWLAGRMETPPPLLQRANAIDSELAGNGWSLRPTTAFFRLDFLACRSLHAEAGLAPEAFVPAVPGQPTEYSLRGHAQFGFSFACQHEPTSWKNHFAMYSEYRARGRLYAAGEPMQYHDLVALGLQGEIGPLLGGLFVSADPGRSMGDYLVIGARLQVGIGANK